MTVSEFYAGKRVLVAGASGFVGTNLARALGSLGATVRGTYLTRRPAVDLTNVNFCKSDLTSYEDCLKATADIDYVFMAAANTSGAAVIERKPLAHLTPNVIMNSQILAASHENQVEKFCFISSNTVYPVTERAVREEDVNFEFFDKYFIVGWMKLFSEKMAEMYATRISNPMSALVVRPGNLYGPHDKFTWEESKVVAALIRKAVEKRDPLQVWGDGNDLKDFLYIDDFISGLLEAFTIDQQFQIINIASGYPVTVKEVLSEILEAANYDGARVEFDGEMPTMLPKRLINVEKIESLSNWRSKTSLAEGIRATVNWYKAAYANCTPETAYKN
jgi:GDP-L-fucose synthase